MEYADCGAQHSGTRSKTPANDLRKPVSSSPLDDPLGTGNQQTGLGKGALTL